MSRNGQTWSGGWGLKLQEESWLLLLSALTCRKTLKEMFASACQAMIRPEEQLIIWEGAIKTPMLYSVGWDSRLAGLCTDLDRCSSEQFCPSRNSIILVQEFLPLCGTVPLQELWRPNSRQYTAENLTQPERQISRETKEYPPTPYRHQQGQHRNSWPHSREKIHCILTSGTEVWSQALFKPGFKEKWQKKIAPGSAIDSYQRAEGCPARRGTGVYSMKPDRQRKGRWNAQNPQPHN